MIKVFSGIRPSGKLHLGNYLGAIKNWIELQDKANQAVFSVVDLHGITTPFDPKKYHEQVMDVVLDYLAAGINPEKALLIRQSKVPQHTELAWIFSTITPLGPLLRLPNYREKIGQVEGFKLDKIDTAIEPTPKIILDKLNEMSKALDIENQNRAKSYSNNLGLLAYPVLMAADILIYKSNFVPVGDDQKQHIDLTNEIGSKFNHLFGHTFEPIKAHIKEGARIMSLKNPKEKMSKMGDSRIVLIDDDKTVRAKLGRAVTDSEKEVAFNPDKKPAISNLITIYHLLSGKEIKNIEKMYEGKSYADFKSDLAEVVVDFLKPFQAKRNELKKDPDYIMSVLTKSEERAKVLASSTLKEIKEKMGLE